MKTWEKYFRQVIPYVPGEQPNTPGMIKLNTNENPYPPAPGVVKAMEELNPDLFKLYPDPTSSVLVKELANTYGMSENEIFVGVGSDDVLGTAFLTFFNSDKPILFPDITYSFYEVWAGLYGIPYENLPLRDDFTINKEDYYKDNGGIIIANPNAPTSICEDLDFIREILNHNQDSIVIIDEAYIDFGGKSAIPLLKEYDNLLVVQTFSKSRSMAGMRIGYAMGSSLLIKAMNHVKYSYNSYTMNQPSLYLGAAALKDNDYHKDCLDRIIATREEVMKELIKLDFTFPESKANFLFATHKSISAEKIYSALREKNIFVRYFAKPRIDNYLRITIGTKDEMSKFITVLKGIIDSNLL